MADIKFRCPECEQKIAVDPSAAGVQIDCPYCKSTIVIPSSAEAPVVMVTRRKLAVLATAGAPADSLNEAISVKQKELDTAVAESKKLREEAENLNDETTRAKAAHEKAAGELERLRQDLSTISTERDHLRERTQELSWQKNIEHDMEKEF